ncbi:MAG: cyclic nucleotide-binding domain-containing protein [Actinobacteria bacterium]|nr:cyclic nucleotide-binding domain-containing protein [Actinomycetota bacterium]
MSVRGMFVSAKETKQYFPGEVVFSQGDASSQMFGVVSGAIDLFRDGELVMRIGPEGTFGEMGIIDGAPRSLTAVAAEATELATIDERTFLFLVQETPMFALQVMRSLAARIRELDDAG